MKSEIRTGKLKKTATNAVTAIASGVGSLFSSGKLKDLEQTDEKLRQEVGRRDKNINECQDATNVRTARQTDTQSWEYTIKSLKPKTGKFSG